MSLFIQGIGTALPATIMTQDEAERIAVAMMQAPPEHAEKIAILYRQTGIRKRHVQFARQVLEDVLTGTRLSDSPFLPNGDPQYPGPMTGVRMALYRAAADPLAEEAARHALQDAGIEPNRITHLVTVSCTGFAAPGTDIALIRRLGLTPTVPRTHIGFMGCHGALNGLRVARGYTSEDANAIVLICAVELCSLHYHFRNDPRQIVANALFADGAAAVVATGKAGSAKDWSMPYSGSGVFPDSEGAMGWQIGDYGFDMSLSPRVPGLIGKHLKPWCEAWLADCGSSLRAIRSWAIHPGGPRIVTGVAEALGLNDAACAVALDVLAECGNMSSPTILFLLARLRRAGAERPCVALGFGPGLAVEAAYFN